MTANYKIQKLLGKKGFSGPIFLVNPSNGSPMTDDDEVIVYLTKKNGSAITGFYSVTADIDDVSRIARIRISGYAPENGNTAKTRFLLGKSPRININYDINDSDEVVDGSGAIVTAGTFSTYFAKDVVKTSGNCEQWKALDLVLALTGSSTFQRTFPVSFSTVEGFATANITQNNVDAAITQNNIDNALVS